MEKKVRRSHISEIYLSPHWLKEEQVYDAYIFDWDISAKSEIYKYVCNEQEVCSLCENLLISGQGSDMVLGFETKVCLRLHTDAFFQQYINAKNKDEI